MNGGLLYHNLIHVKGIYNKLPLSRCLILDFNLTDIDFSLLLDWNLNHGYNSISMEFDFTQMNRTLKKVLQGAGFIPVIKILVVWCLSQHVVAIRMNYLSQPIIDILAIELQRHWFHSSALKKEVSYFVLNHGAQKLSDKNKIELQSPFYKGNMKIQTW